MTDWTTERVQDRLELAADVFRQLPSVKPQGYFNAWPEYFHTFGDKVGQEPRMRRPRPGPREISEAEVLLTLFEGRTVHGDWSQFGAR